MAGNRNPPWTRDELILALDLYFRHAPKLPPSAAHPDVVELSALLNALPAVPAERRAENFRNPAGVYMKLGNFRAIDPELPGGFPAVGRGDREVWAEFAGDRQRLAGVAAAIRRNAAEPDARPIAEADGEQEAPEGRVLLRLHQARERNAGLVKKRKAKAQREHGRLACEACGFEFGAAYGALGDGFIECHHTVPVAALAPGQTTRLADLALLCANCHRMVHRSREPLSVAELRVVVQGNGGA